MDDTINLMRSRNRELKNSLRDLVNNSNEENTEMNLIKSLMKEDKENYASSKMKYFKDLKEQVNDIKNTEYDLPSRSNKSYIIRPRETEVQEPEVILRHQDHENNKQDKSERKYQHKIEEAVTPPIRRNIRSPDYSELTEDISDPLSDSVAPSPKSNLILNKVLHQNEIIEELRQQLNASRIKNMKLAEKNNELHVSNARIMESKQEQIDILNHKLNELKRNSVPPGDVDNLKEDIEEYQRDISHLTSKVESQQSEIETLNNGLRGLTVKLLVYKNKLNISESVNDDLRETYNNLKFFVNKDVVRYDNQFELLNNIVKGNFQGGSIPYDTEQDSTTNMLINDGTTTQLISSKYHSDSLNIDKLIARKENENPPKRLMPYILAAIFISRVRNKVQTKENFNNKVSYLA